MAVTASAISSPPVWTCPRCGWGAPNEAVAFILSALGAGPRPVREVTAEAEAHGIASVRLKAAKKMLRVQFYRAGGRPGIWYWRLP